MSAQQPQDEHSPVSSTSSGAAIPPRTPVATGSKLARVGGVDEPVLVIRRQPPRHMFVDEWFDVEVGLEMPRGDQQQELVELAANLLPYGNKATNSMAAVKVDFMLISVPETIALSTRTGSPRRNRKIRCRLRHSTTGASPTTGSFVIEFVPRGVVVGGGKESTSSIVAPLRTTSFSTVNYKIRVTVDDQWESIWYKDEGGRDKCMDVMAELFNRDNQIQIGEQIPLHLTLLYDNDEDELVRVTKQDLLRTLTGSGKMEIDRRTGQGRIRFRIEDVSKNHQGQDFLVEVAADPKLRKQRDIAPGYTPSVSVRSKRNKRTRPKHHHLQQESMAATSSVLMSSSASGQVGGSLGRDDRNLSPSFASATSRALQQGSDEQMQHLFDAATDTMSLREAMKGVVQWTDEVVKGLNPLYWRVIGYATNPDGSPDYNRPYHNMSNPNSYIDHILSLYSESTRDQLRVLVHAVEQATSDRTSSHSTLPATTIPTYPREPLDPYGLGHNTPPLPRHVQQPMQLPAHFSTTPNTSRRPFVRGMGSMHPALEAASTTVLAEEYRDNPEFFMQYPALQSQAQLSAANYQHQLSSMRNQPQHPSSGQRPSVEDLNAATLPRHSQQQKSPINPLALGYTTVAAPILHGGSSGGFVIGDAGAVGGIANRLRVVGDSRQQQKHLPGRYHDDIDDDDDEEEEASKPLPSSATTRESEVEYVLAKQYKAVRTGERLGFPAYNASKHILGFYRESSTKVGVGQFIPIGHHREDFGPMEIIQATQILEEALQSRSEAVHALKDWGTITNLIDHALVYDWSKDISGAGGKRQGGLVNVNHSGSSSGAE